MNLQYVWRSSSSAPRPNTWTWFRQEFEWRTGDATVVQFAADPTARLLVNGEVVLPRVMRFVPPQITVEEIDLRGALKEGVNVMVVLHHHWGVPTFQRGPGGCPGFAVQGKCLRNASGWMWKNAGEFLAHTHQTIGGGAQRIRFPVVLDTRNETPRLHIPGARLKGFRPAVPVESPAWSNPVRKETAMLERLEYAPVEIVAAGILNRPSGPAPCPEVPMSWEIKHASFRRDPTAISIPAGEDGLVMNTRRDGYVTWDFGKPLHGYLRIEVANGSAGATLDFLCGELRENLRTGEAVLRPDGSFDPELILGTPCGDRVILRGGKQVIEIPEERTLRWLMIAWNASAAPVRLSRVSVMTSQHPAPGVGSFSGGPKTMAAIVSLCLDHARVTMSDAYVDTTGREDGQWLEDIPYRARLAATWFGDTALRQVTLRHAAEQQAPNGRFRVFPPEDYLDHGCQNLDWGLAWIGLLHDDWQFTGESKRLRTYFPNLVRLLDAAHRQCNPEGLLADRTCFSDIRCSIKANHHFGELESIPNAWYHGFLLQAAEIADAINQPRKAALWRERAGLVRKGFVRFLTEDSRVAEVWSPCDGTRGYGQAAVVCAVYHGLVNAQSASRLLRAAFLPPEGSPPAGMRRWNNPTYFYRALRVLSDHGLGEIAGRHFVERFSPYLPDGPLPEYFQLGSAQPDDPTGSHGWAAVPLVWLHDSVLGIRHAEPGGKILRWMPVFAGWPKVSGRVVTPHGCCVIDIDWRKRKFDLTAPPGVRVIRKLPG